MLHLAHLALNYEGDLDTKKKRIVDFLKGSKSARDILNTLKDDKAEEFESEVLG